MSLDLTFTPQSILSAYSAVRAPRANFVQSHSTGSGEIYDSFNPQTDTAEDIVRQMKDRYDPVWFHDIDGDIRTAEDLVGW
jgi:salicylate hydroxylase